MSNRMGPRNRGRIYRAIDRAFVEVVCGTHLEPLAPPQPT